MTFSHQQDVQVLNQDVRHILTSPGRFLPRTRPMWTNWALGLAFASSPLAFAGAAWARRRRRHEAADWVGTRRKRALRDLHKSLGGASNIEAFGEAMEQYLMAKLGWERSQLTREAVHKRLSEHDPGLAEDWIALWNECEMQRYGAVSGNLESLAERLRSLAQKQKPHGHDETSHHALFGAYDARIGDALAQAEQMFEAANEAYEAGNHQLALDTYESILENHRHFESEFNAGNARSSWVSLARPGALRARQTARRLQRQPSGEHRIAGGQNSGPHHPRPQPWARNVAVHLGRARSTRGMGGLVFVVVDHRLALWGLRWKKESPDSRATLAFWGRIDGVGVGGALGGSGEQCADAIPEPTGHHVGQGRRQQRSSSASTVLFQLHEGTRACILDKSAGWTEIELDNGNVGWVPPMPQRRFEERHLRCARRREIRLQRAARPAFFDALGPNGVAVHRGHLVGVAHL